MESLELDTFVETCEPGKVPEKGPSSPSYQLQELRTSNGLESTAVSTHEDTDPLRNEMHLAPVDRGFAAWAMVSCPGPKRLA